MPHTYSTISPPSRGLPSTLSMLLNQITQSLIFYEVNKTMDNEKEHEVQKTKSLHENVDYFQMFILSI
jgi:ABC-type uncharacterized transport system permease subunit